MLITSNKRVLSIGGTEAQFVREDFGDQIELNQIRPERAILERIRSEVQPTDTFLDVGSNLGVYAVFVGLALHDGKVIAVEPNPSTADKLARNLATNEIPAEVAKVAFAASEGRLTLAVPESHGNAAVTPDGDGIDVRAVRGDTYLEGAGLPTPTVVKVDVEGYELAVLRGLESTLDQRDCRLLYCEVHPNSLQHFGGAPDSVRETLHEHGFDVKRIAELPGERYYLRASRA